MTLKEKQTIYGFCHKFLNRNSQWNWNERMPASLFYSFFPSFCFSSSLSPFIIFWQHWDGSCRTSCCKCGCLLEHFLCFKASVTQFIPCKIRHFLCARFLLDFNIYSLWHSDPFAEGMCKVKAQCKVIPSFHPSFVFLTWCSCVFLLHLHHLLSYIFNSVTLLHLDVSQPRPYSMHVSAVSITVCDTASAVCEKESRDRLGHVVIHDQTWHIFYCCLDCSNHTVVESI